ncbi:MAG: hypothetical protein ACRD5K_15595 [Candidatus Acidiferrales bacterium]
MTDYIKAELDQNGVAVPQGSLEKVADHDSASRFSCGDAQFFQREAFKHWPNLDWTTQHVGTDRYVVKADGVRAEKPAQKT